MAPNGIMCFLYNSDIRHKGITPHILCRNNENNSEHFYLHSDKTYSRYAQLISLKISHVTQEKCAKVLVSVANFNSLYTTLIVFEIYNLITLIVFEMYTLITLIVFEMYGIQKSDN